MAELKWTNISDAGMVNAASNFHKATQTYNESIKEFGSNFTNMIDLVEAKRQKAIEDSTNFNTDYAINLLNQAESLEEYQQIKNSLDKHINSIGGITNINLGKLNEAKSQGIIKAEARNQALQSLMETSEAGTKDTSEVQRLISEGNFKEANDLITSSENLPIHVKNKLATDLRKEELNQTKLALDRQVKYAETMSTMSNIDKEISKIDVELNSLNNSNGANAGVIAELQQRKASLIQQREIYLQQGSLIQGTQWNPLSNPEGYGNPNQNLQNPNTISVGQADIGSSAEQSSKDKLLKIKSATQTIQNNDAIDAINRQFGDLSKIRKLSKDNEPQARAEFNKLLEKFNSREAKTALNAAFDSTDSNTLYNYFIKGEINVDDEVTRYLNNTYGESLGNHAYVSKSTKYLEQSGSKSIEEYTSPLLKGNDLKNDNWKIRYHSRDDVRENLKPAIESYVKSLNQGALDNYSIEGYIYDALSSGLTFNEVQFLVDNVMSVAYKSATDKDLTPENYTSKNVNDIFNGKFGQNTGISNVGSELNHFDNLKMLLENGVNVISAMKDAVKVTKTARHNSNNPAYVMALGKHRSQNLSEVEVAQIDADTKNTAKQVQESFTNSLQENPSKVIKEVKSDLRDFLDKESLVMYSGIPLEKHTVEKLINKVDLLTEINIDKLDKSDKKELKSLIKSFKESYSLNPNSDKMQKFDKLLNKL